MPDETIEYTVVVTGDQWDHERFLEDIADFNGAAIESQRQRDDDD